MKILCALLLSLASTSLLNAETNLTTTVSTREGKVAPKPLFRDPIYDGAADPVVIWNRAEKKWFMFYTNRRANLTNGVNGVEWVHGTKIGIAESSDGGTTWKYRGTADIAYGGEGMTHWAPEVIEHNGTYHMFLTFVPGIFTDWQHPRDIIHLTSKDLLKWDYQSTLKLASDRVIDPCVLQLPDGTWRMWYNNERDKKSIYYADSKDLNAWEDKGKAPGTSERGGEGPKVIRWKDHYWMAVDIWAGLRIYRSDDALHWERQPEDILKEPGKGGDDGVQGQHPDMVVSADRAYLFYFTHPGRRGEEARKDGSEQRRSSIQVVELKLEDGWLACNRDEPTHINLSSPAGTSASNQRYKIAVCDWMILKRQKPGAFELAREINADGVELDMGSLERRATFANALTNPVVRRQFLDEARKQNVEICSIAMSGLYAHGIGNRSNTCEMLEGCIETMKQMGVKIAFLPLVNSNDMVLHPDVRPAIVKRLKTIAPKAEAAGVIIGLETTLDAAGEIKLLEEIGSPAIRIYLNFANALQAGRNLSDELRTLGKDRLCQIHCTDVDGDWLQDNKRLDMQKVKQTLDDMGWNGWLVIERSRRLEFVRDVKKNFSTNTAYMKSVFQGR